MYTTCFSNVSLVTGKTKEKDIHLKMLSATGSTIQIVYTSGLSYTSNSKKPVAGLPPRTLSDPCLRHRESDGGDCTFSLHQPPLPATSIGLLTPRVGGLTGSGAGDQRLAWIGGPGVV